MTKEQTVNVDEVTSASKIKLVVTDIELEVSDTSVAQAASTPVSASTPAPAPTPLAPVLTPANVEAKIPANAPVEFDNTIDDADKVMRELPVDEFFKVLERSTPEQLQKLIHTFEKGARTKGGTKLLQKVIEVQKEPRSLLSILMWWEMRRPLYNIAVGLAGLPSVFVLVFLFGQPLMLVLISALAYMFLANLCYSLGTPAESVARTFYKDKAETYGPVLLTLGTIFSVLLTFMSEFAVVALMAFGLFHL